MNTKTMLAIAFSKASITEGPGEGSSFSWLLHFTEHTSSNLLPLYDRNTPMMEDWFNF